MAASAKAGNASDPAREYRIGLLLAFFSAATFSTAGIFAKSVEAGNWETIFWRGVFAAAFTTLYACWRGRFRADFTGMGWSGVFAGAVGAAATLCYLSSFKFTTIANVSLIWATAPILTSVIAWLWIGERLARHKIAAGLVAFGGVTVIFSNSAGGIHLTGDLLALMMTVGMAIMMVIYRRWPQTPAAGPAALSSILLLPVCAYLGDVAHVSLHDFLVLAAFGLIFAIASVTLGEGVRRADPCGGRMVAIAADAGPAWRRAGNGTDVLSV
ncbi:MAG: EamA family transporter [Nitratireductor sp.]|nr:EamA family transporter [Nitratireductor sp.]